jgi:DNA-binding response OmpR family regulator
VREKILIVDDEKKMVRLIQTCLEQEGYETTVAYDGEQALESFAADEPDLVVLDVMMPRLDGHAFCRRLRETSWTPIIILSARSEETDRLVGLELGADDYVTKPFSMRELVARIRAILRRRSDEPAAEAAEVVNGPLCINRRAHRVEAYGREVALTPTEFDMLLLLAASPGHVFTRQELIESCQGEFFEGYERTVDAHVGNIRKKISEARGGLRVIETVYGVGYRLKIEEET